MIFVDVDRTLRTPRGGIDHDLVEWIAAKKNAGEGTVLWSDRGEQYARFFAMRHDIECFFDYIIGKPKIIVDDLGKHWSEHVEIILPGKARINEK